MNLIIWLTVGSIIGWVAGNQIKLQRRRRRVMPKSITIGVVGALLGGLLWGGCCWPRCWAPAG
jgi:uncharacterized membrane protein YeaQ/YmgE (transglycosylase-associated protein family)